MKAKAKQGTQDVSSMVAQIKALRMSIRNIKMERKSEERAQRTQERKAQSIARAQSRKALKLMRIEDRKAKVIASALYRTIKNAARFHGTQVKAVVERALRDATKSRKSRKSSKSSKKK